MRKSRACVLMLLFGTLSATAQVLSPFEIQDPAMRRLQQEHMEDLKSIATTLTQHSFPYPFYFSRKLDVDESVQKQIDQRSIRFEKYNGDTALEITGNYYASYSAQLVDTDHRLRDTYTDVVLPLLQAAVPRFEKDPAVKAFAVEVSHHVRKKVIGVDAEYPENVVVVVPREIASNLIRAETPSAQQELMLNAEVYVDTEPTILWLIGDKPVVDQSKAPPSNPATHGKRPAKASASDNNTGAAVEVSQGYNLPLPQLTAHNVPEELRDAPLHNSSPDALKALQESHREQIDKIVNDLNSTAHFVSYAPPVFIAFKQGSFLQLSMTTELEANAAGSQYRLAALAFDRHISHLVKPVLARIGDTSQFDGVDFSTTVKVTGDKSGTYTQAVEFVLPIAALRCYEAFDCTGQQLLNKGYVLVNGERVGLELQSAEASPQR